MARMQYQPVVTERAEGVQVRLHPDVVLEEIVVRAKAHHDIYLQGSKGNKPS